MADTNVGKAYIQILPTTKGIKSNLQSELGDAGYTASSSFSKSFGSSLTGSIGNIATTIGSTLTSAISSAAGALKNLVSESMSLGADLEQSIGGAEVIFGEETAQTVIANAKKAYESAGLSANDYLEQVSTFSTALISSLGGDTQAAATAADNAINDMADNAAAFGTDMESIQNAYSGFAKQNYTMLDNLKLGYGGTKTEMERLLADAEAFSGVHYDIDNLADVYEAVGQIQKKMGLANHAAEEASSTFSGSFNAMKASWENFLAAMTTGEDLSGYLQNLIDSAVNFFFNNALPMLTQIFDSLAAALPQAIEAFVTYLPTIITSLVNFAVQAIGGLIQALPTVLTSLFTAIADYVSSVDWSAVADNIITSVSNFIEGGNLQKMLDAALAMMQALGSALIQLIPKLIPAALEMVLKLVKYLVENLPSAISGIIGFAGDFLSALIDAFKNIGPSLLSIGADIVNGIWNGIKSMWNSLVGWIGDMCSGIVNGIKGFLGIASPSKVMAEEVGKWIPAGIAAGIEDNMGAVTDSLEDLSDVSVNTAVSSSLVSTASGGYGGDTNITAVNNNDWGTALIQKVNRMYDLMQTYMPGMGEIYLDGEKVSKAVTTRQNKAVLIKSKMAGVM